MITSMSRAALSNFQAFRKLAAASQLKLNGIYCKIKEIHCAQTISYCKNYHVLASNCVHRNVFATKSDFLENYQTGYVGFQQPWYNDSLTNTCRSCIIHRNLLTKNNLTIHSCRRKQNQILQNVLTRPWRSSLSSERQFGLSPKVILEASPKSMQPYLRLIRFDKPTGSYLLFWPCTWSIGLAAEAGHLPNLYILGLFGLGSFLMRGAGCIINDMWDTEIDKRVERTKSRPLASGELSQFQATCMLGVMLSLSLGILLQLNMYSVVLGASSMFLVIMYPLAKRFTYWPQFVLGLTLNIGVLLAWSGLHGSLEWPVIPLYMACVLYTMFYDTIYSHQDKYDDMLVGVKSTALKLGDKTKPWLAGFSGLMLSGLSVTGHLCDQTWPYYLAVTATGAHLLYQLTDVDLNNPDDCFAKFKANSWLGVVMFVGIVAGTLLKEDKKVKDEKQEKDQTA